MAFGSRGKNVERRDQDLCNSPTDANIWIKIEFSTLEQDGGPGKDQYRQNSTAVIPSKSKSVQYQYQ